MSTLIAFLCALLIAKNCVVVIVTCIEFQLPTHDKESSLVNGMPGVAINSGAAGYVLNQGEIADIIKEIESYC